MIPDSVLFRLGTSVHFPNTPGRAETRVPRSLLALCTAEGRERDTRNESPAAASLSSFNRCSTCPPSPVRVRAVPRQFCHGITVSSRFSLPRNSQRCPPNVYTRSRFTAPGHQHQDRYRTRAIKASGSLPRGTDPFSIRLKRERKRFYREVLVQAVRTEVLVTARRVAAVASPFSAVASPLGPRFLFDLRPQTLP